MASMTTGSTILNSLVTTTLNSTSVAATTEKPYVYGAVGADNATWVLICTFIIFTMQSGFGLLESGCVTSKNEINIMYKNAADVIFGGIVYWLVGYGLSFGDSRLANKFCGWGYFAINVTDPQIMGDVFVSFVFQLSFATTAATIVSGAMAERVKLHSYIIYAMFNTFAYCIPAHWVWDGRGFLNELGVVDIAGSGVVHLCGGTAAWISSMMLGPRKGRYDNGPDPIDIGNSTNVILGTMMLWWGWMGFNMGSTYGVLGGLWVSAAKGAANTLIASMGGGLSGVIFSIVRKKMKYSIPDLCNGVLGGLVGVTAPCAVVYPWEAFIIGVIGGLVAVIGVIVFDKLRIDDPVGAISVHGLAGFWGLISVGLFMSEDKISGLNNGNVGLFHGGGFRSLGVQLATAVCIFAWAALIAMIINGLLRVSPLGLRMSAKEEEVGADFYEHEVGEEPEIHVDVLKSEQTGESYAYLYGRRRSAFGYRREETNDEKAEQKATSVFEQDIQKFQAMNARLNKALEICEESDEEEEESSVDEKKPDDDNKETDEKTENDLNSSKV